MEHSWKAVPKLGFGLMRLPMLGDEVDIEQFKTMVDRFMEAGFTYFDTAYGYINGKSEAAAKVALVERYPRDSFTLATKLPAWAGPKTAEEAKQMFWTSLERTGAGYFDYYLLHNIGEPRLPAFDNFGIWDFLKERKAEGLIKHLGFSFHDSPEMLDRVLTDHPDMDFIQLQINYADWEDPAIQSRGCYEVARKHGKSIVVMEPVKGGSLANLPEDAAKPFLNAGMDPVAGAIRFAASLDGIITVLSGMSTLEQVRDNTQTMMDFRPLTDEERKVISRAVAKFNDIPLIPCTGCRYCAPDCPQKINIPGILASLNDYTKYQNAGGLGMGYRMAIGQGGKAGDCVECRSCEEHCPQHLKITQLLKKAAEVFEK